MRFRKLLGIAMSATGTGCAAWAAAFGHNSAWWAAAMCFCAAAVCLIQRQKPSKEG